MKHSLRIMAFLILFLLMGLVAVALAGCTKADRVSHNVSEEADNFKVFRRVVVVNTVSDKILFELDGYFSLYVDAEEDQLEVTVNTGRGEYKKHFIGLGKMVAYTVEDLSGAEVDPYHYELHYLPEGNVQPFTFRGVDE